MFVTSRHSEYFGCEGAKSVFKELLEGRNDQHGRNSLLMTYVHYQCGLSPAGAEPPPPTVAGHTARASSLPRARAFNSLPWAVDCGLLGAVDSCSLFGAVDPCSLLGAVDSCSLLGAVDSCSQLGAADWSC
ncbi:hypothetical protein FJT64_022403 [Amphibalanus amphitrite]|uniref:Uncharacterized protein n=1 Tax=Amphibalanus amphitrite TaxID=1232801 RepID=A0A6A4WQP3_AMPAM|nr:hypothetical protein FJT64_022403 [Amphibalanus amphitrite]